MEDEGGGASYGSSSSERKVCAGVGGVQYRSRCQYRKDASESVMRCFVCEARPLRNERMAHPARRRPAVAMRLDGVQWFVFFSTLSAKKRVWFFVWRMPLEPLAQPLVYVTEAEKETKPDGSSHRRVGRGVALPLAWRLVRAEVRLQGVEGED